MNKDSMDQLKIDLHVHTRYSLDSKTDIKELIKTLKKKDIAGFAVTDHNEIKGALEAYNLGKEYGIIVIRGSEISSEKGHILAYGIDERIDDELSVEDTIETVTRAGGICSAAHPFRKISGIGGTQVKKHKFSSIETLNSRSAERENIRAIKLANLLERPQTGGSDAHELKYLGNAYTMFPSGISTEEECLEAIRKGNVHPEGRSVKVNELVKYYLSVGTKWVKRGFKKI